MFRWMGRFRGSAARAAAAGLRVQRLSGGGRLLAVLLIGWAADAKRAEAGDASRLEGRRFILTQDSRDICLMAPQGQAQAWLRDWYRKAFAAGVDVFVADVVQPELSVVKDTPSAEIVGARTAGGDPDKIEGRYRTISELRDQGTDLLHLAAEEGHAAGALVLAGMRMSDAHHGGRWVAHSEHMLYPQIIMDHPEWCNVWEDGSLDATFNYAIPAVRAHRLQILRELATNYDIDGLELDWMRHCRHFPDGKQREYVAVMTEFLGEVRAMLDEVAKQKGAPRMLLGHRLPGTLDECLHIGCDVASWVERGLADYLTPMDFLHYDPNMRVEELVQAAGDKACPVYPGFGSVRYSLASRYQPRDGSLRRTARLSTLDQYRAAAANWFAWGGAGASVYNLIGWAPEHQAFYLGAIATMSDPARAFSGPRHYVFLPTWKDHVPMTERMRYYSSPESDWTGGFGPDKRDRMSTGYIQLPDAGDPGAGKAPTGRLNAQSLVYSAENVGQRQTFDFRMADGRQGEKLRGWLRLRIYDATPDDVFAIDLNGVPVPPERWKIEHFPQGETGGRADRPVVLPDDGTIDFPPSLRFEAALEDCPPLRGDNQLGVVLVRKNAAGAAKLVLEAVEAYVR